MTAETEQSENDNKERQLGQDNWDKIAMAGKPEQDSGTGRPGQDSWDRLAGTRA